MVEHLPPRASASGNGHTPHYSGNGVHPAPEAEGPSIAGYLTSIRRHLWLVVLLGAVGLGLSAVTLWRSETRYISSTVLQMTDDRPAPSGGGLAGLAASLGGGGGSMASRVEIIRSRLIMGQVVDSLGLRLSREVSGVLRNSYRPTGLIDEAHVSADATAGQLELAFTESGVSVRSGERVATAAYGEPVEIDGVRFVVPSRPAEPELTLLVMSRDDAIDALLAEVSAFPREGTNLIDIVAGGYDPHITRRLADSIAAVYQEFSGRRAREQAEKRREFVQQQLTATEDLLRRTQDALTEYRQSEGLFSSQAKAIAEQTGSGELDLQRAELRADREMYRTLLAQIPRGERDTNDILRTLVSAPSVAQNPIVTQLYGRLSEYHSARDSLVSGPNRRSVTDPDVVRLDSLMALTQERVIAAMQSHVEALGAQISALDMIQARADSTMQHLAESEPEEMRLILRMESIAEAAQDLRGRFYAAGMAEAGTLDEITVLDGALPGRRAGTTSSRVLVLGLIFGVMVGGAGALVLDGLNRSIRRRDEMERHLRVPGLGVIPRLAPGGLERVAQRLPGRRPGGPPALRGVGSELVAAVGVNSFGAEAYRTLRTNLLFSPATPGLRSVVVTSPSGGEGKTTTAANLAVAFAQKGMRVLLVDGDLRRPRVHSLFGARKAPGLTELLTGEISLDEAIQETRVPGVSILSAGGAPSVSPTDLLAADVVAPLIETLSADYGLIILDTPPVLLTANAAILGTAVDGVLLVIRAGQTDRDSAREAMEQLTAVGAHVLGAVLNDPSATMPRKASAYYQDLGARD